MKQDVFSDLFKEHYNGAVLYAYAVCRDYALAEDVVANAFFKAFTTMDDTVKNFRYWLLRVCRNGIIDAIRKRKRNVKLTDDLADPSDAAERLIADEEYRALYRAIELLGEEYREVITLFYFEDLSIAETAKVVGKTVENVKVTLYRARQKLKKILEAKNEI